MKTLASLLDSKHCLIDPELNLEKPIPFGMKVTTRIPNLASKIEPRGEVLRELMFEKYSNSMQLLNLESGKIKVSCDYTVTASNPTLSMNQLESSLPSVSSLKIKLQLPSPQLTDFKAQSPADQLLDSKIQPPI
ncbi:hypothetical protein O181_088478 [Austropuccinia psidii MF-1]|uniref:Uncharacterized protein n=1 Tax=Austropuccinia psidii MF-1 TaxID=1389203 RepID=A0A9Q3P2X5_9BASI|nr:hypothetical protein [Austropuccinia psidii MF-1]